MGVDRFKEEFINLTVKGGSELSEHGSRLEQCEEKFESL